MSTLRGMAFLSSFLIAALACCQAEEQAEVIEQDVLFESGRGGYHTYRIPSLIVTTRGTLLAFCEGRKEGRGDSGDIDLLLKRSEDGGSTWSEPMVVWDDGENTCGNPCPVVDRRTGRVCLLLTWNLGSDGGRALHDGTSAQTRRVFECRSDDDGRTWTEPVEITGAVKDPGWRWYATGPGIGIQLEQEPHRGRLVVPCDHTDPAGVRGSHAIYSDDGGETWHRSEPIVPLCNESQVVELADGRLMMNMRTQPETDGGEAPRRVANGHRSIAYSRDGGRTWTAPVFDDHLGDPICQASLIRFDAEAEGDRGPLLFSNPSPPIRPGRGERVRMTVRRSDDEGKTWPVGRLIHAGPSAYSCLARLPDGRVGLLYEAGEAHASEGLTFARFSLGWLAEGRRESGGASPR